MPIKRIQQTVPLRILDWQRCVGLFLEGFSLLCELHGAQVPEGRVEPLVVVPPHVPVDVRAQLLHVRVDVPVDELLPDEPVGGFDHRAVVRVARPGKGTRDAEHVEHAFDAFPGEPAAAIRVEHLDLIQREAQRGERGQHEIGVVPDADRMAGDLPAGQVAGQADVRPRTADPHVGRVGGQMGARCISSSRCFVFSHVFFSGLGSCMHFPYFSGCAEVFLPNRRASLTRRLWPVNSRSRPWCTMRSMIAAASLSSAKTVPHLLNSMFVVNMMLRLS